MKRLSLAAIIFLMVLGSAVSVFAAEKNIVKIGANILIERNTSVNDIVAIDGSVVVLGDVDGNVVMVGGGLKLGPGSKVGQDIVLIGASLERDPSAIVGGKITDIGMPSSIPFVSSLKSFFKGGWIAVWAAVSVMVLLGFLGLAVLAAALVPEHLGAVVKALDKSFVSMFLWGILGAFLAGLVIILLAITIVGIILIPLAIVVITLAWIVGYIASAIFIGRNIMVYFKKTPPPFVDAILGIAVLFLAGFLPLIGPLVIKPIFLFAGFGAVLVTRFGTVK